MRLRWLCAWVLFLCLTLFGVRDAAATTTIVESDAGAPPPSEAIQPDSPRASMARFLDATHQGKFDEAMRFLDLSKADAKRGQELARRLDAVLKHRLWIEPEELSPRSKGAKDNNAAVELGKIGPRPDKARSVQLTRHEATSKDDEPRWVFSRETVSHVDEWYDGLPDRWVRERLPEVLLRPGPKDVMWWQWLALPLFAIIAFGLGRLLTVPTRALLRLFAKRTEESWALDLVHDAVGPMSMAWGLLLLYITSDKLALYEPAEIFYKRVLRALLFVAFFWGVLRSVKTFGKAAKDTEWVKNKPSLLALSTVGVRGSRIVLSCVAVIAVLSELGYPVASLIAGLGLGGIAFALAAQKTVENLFGSVSILADQPFRVGDSIKVDGISGTVETIGLRSTRLRTDDRSLIVIPNGKLADMRVENLASRDRIRFSSELFFAPSSSPEALTKFCEAVRESLANEKDVKDATVHYAPMDERARVRVAIAAFVQTKEVKVFADTQDTLMALLLGLVKKHGLVFEESKTAAATPPAPK